VQVTEPLSFERVARAQVAGCFAYLLILPTLSLIGALVGGGLAAGFLHLTGLSGKTVESILLLGFAGIGGLGSAALVIREYRRRAGTRIVIHDDRLEVLFGNTPEIFRFQDLEWISGPSLAHVSQAPTLALNRSFELNLKRPGARPLKLQVEEWPVKEMAKVLLERAVPVQVQRLEARLEAGEIVDFRPSPFLALRYLITGMVCSIGSALLWYAWWQKIRTEKSVQVFALPLLLAVAGVSALFMVPRARGGVWVSRDGLRKQKGGSLIPWTKVAELQVLPDAVDIRIDDGSTLTLGMLARNYDAGLALLQARRPGPR
jgi:hypothetical protein